MTQKNSNSVNTNISGSRIKTTFQRTFLLASCASMAICFSSLRGFSAELVGPLGEMPECTEPSCSGTVLRGDVLDNSGVRDVSIAPNVEQERSDLDRRGSKIPFSISVDGETLLQSDHPGQAALSEKSVNRQRNADVGLSAVDIQVKFDGLEIHPLLNVSTVPIRHTYKVGEPVRFLATSNYPAFIERAEIRIFSSSNERSDDTLIETIPIPINGEAGWIMGETHHNQNQLYYVLRVYDDCGRYDQTQPRELASTVKEFAHKNDLDSTAPGMGDDYTALRNIPVSGGSVTIYGRNIPEGYQVRALNDVIPIDINRRFVAQRILPSGDHNVDVSILGSLKGGQLAFNRQINIPKNDWFYVGLADITAGKRFGDKNIEKVRDAEYNKIYTKGRLTFYLKGKIMGKYLLTAAVDSNEDELKNLFKRDRDPDSRHQLLRHIDPDSFYPLYGDDSTAINDAPTDGKFYVRLERGDSHVMWGNYKATIKGTEFMRSDRALYGAGAVYRSEGRTSFDERNTNIVVYAAQPATLPQRDEFLGTGGSSYFLQRQDIVVGSDTVSIEMRDPITGQVVERRTLRNGEDYTFDYLQGLVILKRPLSSWTGTTGPVRDSTIGGSKAYLIAQYEFTPGSSRLDGYVNGGRVQQWFGDKIRLGVTAMDEKTGTIPQKAYGADIQIRHSEKSFVEGEFSQSDGPGLGLSRSTDGGLTLSNASVGGSNARKANAWRSRAQLDLEDITGLVKGTVGGYYENKKAGFSTLADQIAIDRRVWGAHTKVDLTDKAIFTLSYDDFKEGRPTSTKTSIMNGNQLGGGVKRKGNGSISHQFNDYWKTSLGISYTDFHNPRAIWAKKAGYNGYRIDGGIRLDYLPNDDQAYYVFGQGTLSRAGDINRGDRGGVGAKYQLTDKIGVEGEVSYGKTGFGGLAGLTYKPTADDNYYFGYRLDADRAFGLDLNYDLAGTDRGTIVLGARRKLNDTLSAYAENNYDLFGRRVSLTKTYGVTYMPDSLWTVDGGFEAGSVEDDNINSSTGLVRSDFDRKAVSLSVGYKNEERGIDGRIRGAMRFEESQDNTRDANTYLAGAGLSWKTSEDWRLLTNVDAVLSDRRKQTYGSFRNADYIEASAGYAYRPVNNDRLNALFKYSWIYDLPGPDQFSAKTHAQKGPAQRTHILSADFTYEVWPWLSMGGKYGMRYGEKRYRNATTQTIGPWKLNTAHLGIVRADFHIVRNWDLLAEARVMRLVQAKLTDYGPLLALYRHVGDNFKIGAGYNFGAFSDDLANTLNDQGLFLNLIGKF